MWTALIHLCVPSCIPSFLGSIIRSFSSTQWLGFRNSIATNLVRKSWKAIICLQIAPQNMLYIWLFFNHRVFFQRGPKDALGWSGQTKEGCGILGITSKEASKSIHPRIVGNGFKYRPGNESISHLEKRKIGDTLVPRRVVVWSTLRYAKKHPTLSIIQHWIMIQILKLCDFVIATRGMALLWNPSSITAAGSKQNCFGIQKLPKRRPQKTFISGIWDQTNSSIQKLCPGCCPLKDQNKLFWSIRIIPNLSNSPLMAFLIPQPQLNSIRWGIPLLPSEAGWTCPPLFSIQGLSKKQ